MRTFFAAVSCACACAYAVLATGASADISVGVADDSSKGVLAGGLFFDQMADLGMTENRKLSSSMIGLRRPDAR